MVIGFIRIHWPGLTKVERGETIDQSGTCINEKARCLSKSSELVYSLSESGESKLWSMGQIWFAGHSNLACRSFTLLRWTRGHPGSRHCSRAMSSAQAKTFRYSRSESDVFWIHDESNPAPSNPRRRWRRRQQPLSISKRERRRGFIHRNCLRMKSPCSRCSRVERDVSFLVHDGVENCSSAFSLPVRSWRRWLVMEVNVIAEQHISLREKAVSSLFPQQNPNHLCCNAMHTYLRVNPESESC